MTRALLRIGRCAMVLMALACARSPVREEGDQLRLVTPEGHTAPVFDASFSRDTQFVVTASDDGTARIWEAPTGREVRRLEVPRVGRDGAVWIRAAAFSPDGGTVVTGSYDGSVRLWSPATGREIRRLPPGHSGPIRSAAFSPDGRLIVTASEDSTARLWDARTGRPAGSPMTHRDLVNTAAFSPDGRYVVTASSDSTAHIWDGATGASVRLLPGHRGWVTSAAFSHDGRLVVTTTEEETARLTSDGTAHVGTAHIWNAATGDIIRQIQRHSAKIRSAAFSPDDRRVVTVSSDGTGSITDLTSGTVLPLEGGTDPLRAVSFSPDPTGRYVVAASHDHTGWMWSSVTGKLIRRFQGHAQRPNAASFSPDGRLVVTAVDDGSGRIWEIGTGREVRQLRGHTGPVRAAAFSPDGRLVATASLDSTVRLWNPTTGGEKHQPFVHSFLVWSAAFSADARFVVSASADSTARLWDADSGRAIGELKVGGAGVNSAAFSPDGRSVVTASGDSRAQFWAVSSRQTSGRPMVHRGRVNSATFSPDGRLLVTASDDSTARLWDAASGRPGHGFSGHRGFVAAAGFSPDGRRVVTASYDRTARVWDVGTGREIRALEGHAGWVHSAVFSPDGRFVVTASSDGTTRVWNPATGSEIFRRYMVDSTGWVIVAADGRFDGNEQGLRRLHYARGLRTIRLEAFFRQFYTPGLAGLLLAGAPYNGPDLRRGFSLPPYVRIAAPISQIADSGTTAMRVIIEAEDNGGGVKDVRLYHDGSLVASETSRGEKARLVRSTSGCPQARTCFETTVELLAGMNTLEATAFARDSTEAERSQVTITVPVTPGRPDPTKLYVLAVGISSYQVPRYNLNYGRADAVAFTNAIRAGAGSIFSDVIIRTLHDASATRDSIEAALGDIARVARPRDVFVFFYAGHGTSERDGKSTRFFLVPSDVEQITNVDDLRRKGLSAEELMSLFEAIPARKKLMVVDACQSGGIVAGFARRGAAEERAIAQLARSSGLFVISATDSEQFAHEVAELGNGILTAALLRALEGGIPDSGKVGMVRQLLSETEYGTHELSRILRRDPQYPMVFS
ncbi:MAG: caspase family protein, partial [Gemmatimonadaceae bacterium]